MPDRLASPRPRATPPAMLGVLFLLLAACAPRIAILPATGVKADTGAAIDAPMRDGPRPSPACFGPVGSSIPDRLVIGGQERRVLSHAPAGPHAEPRDLVIAFHGRTNDVACRLGDRVRAVASVAGGLQGGTCIGGTAALLIHHPDDVPVPMSAGERGRDAFLAANGLADATATPAAHPALATLGCVRYGDADVPDPVVWCAHDDATWPSGRYDPHAWPAAAPAAIAAFFRHLP